MTKPTVDSIIKECNIRVYNGSWYVQEDLLKKVLEKVIEKAYNAGWDDAARNAYEHCVNFGESK